MKKKSKNARLKRKNEFRTHKVEIITKKGRIKKIDHPVYVFLEKGNIYIYVSITHSSKVEDYIVVKLGRNPNPHDPSNAYVVLDVRCDTKSSFGGIRRGWSINEIDEKMIRNLFEGQKEKDDSPSTSNDCSSR